MDSNEITQICLIRFMEYNFADDFVAATFRALQRHASASCEKSQSVASTTFRESFKSCIRCEYYQYGNWSQQDHTSALRIIHGI